MDHADPPIPIRQARIARAEADRLFLCRDRLLDCTGEKLAEAEGRYGSHPVAIERDRAFVFGYRRLEPALRAQHLTPGEVSDRIAWRGRQHVANKRLGAFEIGC